jgi:Rps23 Pro-64 3,4-dihydroxylase Tpa1-like proline 4-hydroxylase
MAASDFCARPPNDAAPRRPDECLDYERLMSIAVARAGEYAAATPFPHVVIDDLLSPEVIARVIAKIPPSDGPARWVRWEGNAEDGILAQKGKQHISDERQLGSTTRQLLYELRSAAFLEILQTLTGIRALLPDPYNVGGGLHISERGAVLRIHADFLRHPLFHLERRLNLILYLNHDWPEVFGGHLELWTSDMAACARRIAPQANRCVIFTTSASSYHGHPDPLACPADRRRISLALYYYTNTTREQVTGEDFKTSWRNRPPR